jgi:hypothetical protein
VELSEPAEGVQAPAAFTWRGTRYEVLEVLSARTEVGFGAGEVTRTWYRRRHRNYWRVRASDGKLYELYLDRGSGRRIWTLGKCLSPPREGAG